MGRLCSAVWRGGGGGAADHSAVLRKGAGGGEADAETRYSQHASQCQQRLLGIVFNR